LAEIVVSSFLASQILNEWYRRNQNQASLW
jgi:hypothetical protein